MSLYSLHEELINKYAKNRLFIMGDKSLSKEALKKSFKS